jgi:hypothetical protein
VKFGGQTGVDPLFYEMMPVERKNFEELRNSTGMSNFTVS